MWAPDGRQLYFVRRMGRESAFYSVEIRQTGSTFEIGNSRRMFSVDDLYIAEAVRAISSTFRPTGDVRDPAGAAPRPKQRWSPDG